MFGHHPLGRKAITKHPLTQNQSNMKLIHIAFLFFLGLNINAQEGNFVETNGVKIYYEIHGEGEPLLLLHGFTLSSKRWAPWIEDLSKDHQLIIPDLRGHGNSTNPSKAFTHKMAAIDMYGLMDHLKIDRFQAMGQSSGAMTLIQMATMDSSRISSMILVAGTSFFPKETRDFLSGVSYETYHGSSTYMKALHPRGEEQIRMILKQWSNMSESYEDMNFTAPFLSTIRCPTLIIHGDRDSFFPVDIPVSIYQAIPKSYLWIVPNNGHSPAGIYDRKSIWSDILFEVVTDFFGGNWK